MQWPTAKVNCAGCGGPKSVGLLTLGCEDAMQLFSPMSARLRQPPTQIKKRNSLESKIINK